MTAKRLDNRGIVSVSGADAVSFLHGLVTADIEQLRPDAPKFGALLTPQGKILFDFITFRNGDEILIDIAASEVEAFVRRLGMYKLRSEVEFKIATSQYCVVIDGDASGSPADPRLFTLGTRQIVAKETAPYEDGTDAFNARCTEFGIAEAGRDFDSADVFPHEANHDLLNGIDMEKGCYVGQEVVSRMQHRGTARKRFLPCRLEGEAPLPGAEIWIGEKRAGHATSSAGGYSLALLRLDRISSAIETGNPLVCGNARLWPQVPQCAEGSAKTPTMDHT